VETVANISVAFQLNI